MLASKLTCLLQRRHIPDLFDLVYSIFINRDLDVNRREVLTTFFKKTVYQRQPGVAKQLLLGLPLATLRDAWSRYIVVPVAGLIDFDVAIEQFPLVIEQLFSAYVPAPLGPSFGGRPMGGGLPETASSLRTLETRSCKPGVSDDFFALPMTGVNRLVEPYSIVFKTRKDGHGDEYLYVYDRTGGRSGPGIKSLILEKVEHLQILDERFAPRYPIELSKVGTGYFARPFGGGRLSFLAGRIRALRHGWRYTVECNHCNRHFKRMRRDTTLKPHKDGNGNACFGRRGTIVDQQLV